jgi:hypothetical protein
MHAYTRAHSPLFLSLAIFVIHTHTHTHHIGFDFSFYENGIDKEVACYNGSELHHEEAAVE